MNSAMDAVIIKSRLHEYIEQADNKHLEAIYVLLEKEIYPPTQYDAATLNALYELVNKDMNGLSKSYTIAETFAAARNQGKK